VKERPDHIDRRELARTLQERWGLAPDRLRHLPVGFGDHHWELTDAAGGRWFITVAALADGWRGAGPARHAPRVGRALARFDELVRETAESGPVVITHGEPHPGNILRTAGRLYLIDWDTVGLALPERDLWLVAGDDARAADRYAELTGRRVSGAAVHLYRMRWSLDDIALAVRDFRGPHEQDEDTGLMWETLTGEIEQIRRFAR
jgi:spectinomycin phosphotransferase